jgi:hypothetical protein
MPAVIASERFINGYDEIAGKEDILGDVFHNPLQEAAGNP